MASQCGLLDAPQFSDTVQREFRLHTTPSWTPAAGLVTAITLLAALPAHACWEAAAARYRVSSELLYAIARTESALNPQAVGRNANGTRDIGLMQINSTWLPTLATHGIGERDLFDACTNIHVGAWILAGNVQRLGYTWDAVGAYNAASPARRRAYAEKVRRHLRSTTAAAPPVRERASRAAITQGSRRPPVVATLPLLLSRAPPATPTRVNTP
jgi:soluble lytic murein transglycosylase-like protein